MNMEKKALLAGLLVVSMMSGCLMRLDAPSQSYADDEIVALVEDADERDIRTIFEGHYQALSNTSGYEISQRFLKNRAVEQHRVLRVDRARQRVLFKEGVEGEGAVRTKFINETGNFVRYSRGSEDTTYRVRSGSADTFERSEDTWSSMVLPPIPRVVTAFDYEFVGSENGNYVFTADSLRPPSEAEYSPWKQENVEEVRARLVIDKRGAIRELSFTVDSEGPPSATEFRFRVSKVNETWILVPAWVEKAKAETDER